jgi:hypothetical protein
VLTLSGTKDGLMRVTRSAEAYWHGMTNVQSSQAGKYPVVILEGMSHAGYMDGTMLPKFVV